MPSPEHGLPGYARTDSRFSWPMANEGIDKVFELSEAELPIDALSTTCFECQSRAALFRFARYHKNLCQSPTSLACSHLHLGLAWVVGRAGPSCSCAGNSPSWLPIRRGPMYCFLSEVANSFTMKPASSSQMSSTALWIRTQGCGARAGSIRASSSQAGSTRAGIRGHAQEKE